ncbi:MAG: DNA-directed RNA polymerase subunit beta', partial [Actinomycetota bacterium]|nr:DNA-directed RNA polymerase subunit beta' [Actinomycetota bacterium]
ANNILSPAHGAPLATPTQDMVLGAYYLTYGPDPGELVELEGALREGRWDEARDGRRPHVFGSAQEAELSYEHGRVALHDLAEYRRGGEEGHLLTTVGRIMFNERIERALAESLDEGYDPSDYEFVNQSLRKRDLNQVIEALVDTHGPYASALVLDAFKDLGFQFATRAGITISKNDVVVPPEKEGILDRYEGEVSRIQDQYDGGLITQEERHEAVVEKWTTATEEVGEAMQENLHGLNPVYMMANSGARGSFKQIRQLAGMRGLMANPKGDIIERPIKANFMEGLSVLEYFVSTHGARKGLADTALRTADSGYLTRRLVDVSQDVIVRIEDCGTEEFIEMPLRVEDNRLNPNLAGRLIARPLTGSDGETLLEQDELVTAAKLEGIVAADGDGSETARELPRTVPLTVPVRSVLKCAAEAGVCQRCYGVAPATGKLVAIGDAVGIIAAQSIGEPGTQLTMRTFHTGGVAGADITHGLPRVVELFEARKPKGLAVLSHEEGTVSIEDTDKARRVTVTDPAGTEHAYTFAPRTRLFVEPGERIEVGAQLNEGSLYPHELLETRGRTETELYLLREVQRVYKSQGVDINDKHIELIARQMLKKVRVEQKGDSRYLPGQLVDRHELAAENTRVAESGGDPAQIEEIILGITKASLATDSFLSAASFQETTKVLTDAALEGKTDRLLGLKENVIIGKLIPAATGLRRYRRLEIEPTEPAARPSAAEVGLLDEAELAAELGLTGDGDLE